MRKKLILLFIILSITGSTLTSCGNNNANNTNISSQNEIKNIDPEEVINKITSSVELRAMGTLNEEETKEIFKLDLDQIEKVSIKKGQMNTGLETIAIIKAKSGQVETIKKSLEEYKKSIHPLYPGEQEAVDSATLIEKGNYLGFFIIPNYESGQSNLDKVIEIFENEFK